MLGVDHCQPADLEGTVQAQHTATSIVYVQSLLLFTNVSAELATVCRRGMHTKERCDALVHPSLEEAEKGILGRARFLSWRHGIGDRGASVDEKAIRTARN